VSVAVPFAGAQDWNSSFNVVNMGTGEAWVTVTFYEEDGTAHVPDPLNGGMTNPFTLTAGTSFEVYLPGIPSLADGRYSVVISADQPIAAIANLVGDSDPVFFNGSYSGVNEGDMAMYLPAITKAYYGWNSNISMQNLTAAEMQIAVNFYAGTPTPVIPEMTMMVPAFASWHLDVGAIAGLPDGYNGSAVVSAAGPIAAMDNQIVGSLGLTQDYNGFMEGATTLYCPALYEAYYTWNSSINVQNVGATTTTVNITYSDGETNSWELGPSAAHLFYQPDEDHTAATFSGVITSAEPVVAIVNAANPMNQAQTYNCFSSGSTAFFAPIVEKNYYGWDSAVQVQNVGAVDADVTITYNAAPGCSETKNVPAGGTAEFYQPGVACLPVGYGASASLSSLQPFVAIVNQTLGAYQTGTQGDWSMSYNAFGE
jgi:hypothetical protein